MPTPFEIHLNKLRDLKKSLAKCSRPKAQRHIKTLIVAEETRWQLKGSDEELVAFSGKKALLRREEQPAEALI